MVEELIQLTIYGTSFSIMSFVYGIIVRRDSKTNQYTFLWSTRFTRYWKAAVAAFVNALIGIGVEQWAVQPYLITLFAQHGDKVLQLFLCGVGGLLATIWLHMGLTKQTKMRIIWAMLCFFVGVGFVEGLRIMPLW